MIANRISNAHEEFESHQFRVKDLFNYSIYTSGVTSFHKYVSNKNTVQVRAVCNFCNEP